MKNTVLTILALVIGMALGYSFRTVNVHAQMESITVTRTGAGGAMVTGDVVGFSCVSSDTGADCYVATR